jgi:hypothetical protein
MFITDLESVFWNSSFRKFRLQLKVSATSRTTKYRNKSVRYY